MSRLPAPSDDALLTTGEAAAMFAVDPRTIARWCDAGALEARRTVGGRRRVRRGDLIALMHEHGMVPPGARPEALRVAVIDDDPLLVRSSVRALRRAFPAAQLGTALNGFAAGVLMAELRPHVVLLDVVMPGLSGVEVCSQIRSTRSLVDTRVIIVSGHVDRKLQAELVAVGADHFVHKPFTAAVLVAAVRAVVPEALLAERP